MKVTIVSVLAFAAAAVACGGQRQGDQCFKRSVGLTSKPREWVKAIRAVEAKADVNARDAPEATVVVRDRVDVPRLPTGGGIPRITDGMSWLKPFTSKLADYNSASSQSSRN